MPDHLFLKIVFAALVTWETIVIADKVITFFRNTRKGTPLLRVRHTRPGEAAAAYRKLIESSQQPIADFERAMKASRARV